MMARKKGKYKSFYKPGIINPKQLPQLPIFSHDEDASFSSEKNNISSQISAPILNIVTKSFGRIYKTLTSPNANPEYIKEFFIIFDEASTIILTVKDQENPTLDAKSFIIAETERTAKRISARLFLALLPRELLEIISPPGIRKEFSDEQNYLVFKKLMDGFDDKELDLEEQHSSY